MRKELSDTTFTWLGWRLGDMIPRLNLFDLLLSMILYMSQRWWLGGPRSGGVLR